MPRKVNKLYRNQLASDIATLFILSNCCMIFGKLDNSLDDCITIFSRSDIFVFLLSTRAGGLGINLTAADTVSYSLLNTQRIIVLCSFKPLFEICL